MEIQKGDKYFYARVATNEVVDMVIRSVYDDCVVGTSKGYAYLIYKKKINKLLYTNRKLAVEYLKEHQIVYKEEE